MLDGTGTLDSAVTPGAKGAKNFLLRDGKETLPCVFYEIVSILCPHITQSPLTPFLFLNAKRKQKFTVQKEAECFHHIVPNLEQ